MAAVLLATAVLHAVLPHLHAQAVQPTTAQPATVAAIALAIRSRAIQDSRCYLMNGGAVESFFISEDTPVGSVIGTLSVNGDPSEAGDITLRLQEQGAAIGVAPGTKNLTLLRPLDREELRGPSNVYVNVRCDRRRTTDPSFVIPVSVRVWDVNDNAPVWVGAPYHVRLSELTAVGARVLRVRATDADQPGPHATIVYSVLPGPHTEYFGFVNELDSVLVVKKPLDFETLRNFTIALRAQDQGTPPLHNDTTLSVEVLDADDQNPKFTHEHYTAILPDDAEPGTILETSPGPVSAADQDVGINAPLQYSTTGDYKHLIAVEQDTGRIVVTDDLLKQQAPVTAVIKATQVDNADRYALATLSISRLPTVASVVPVTFAKRQYDAATPEDAPPGTVLATLHTDPPHHRHQSPLQFYVSDRSFLEKFAINSAGEVLLRRPLDFETAESYHYQVMVTDGVSNDTASINITVLNVNEWEPRFRYPQYEFRVEAEPEEMEDEGLLPVGRLDVFDGDKPDTVALSLRGPDASMLSVNELGEVFLRSEALRDLNSSVLHVVATAVDSGTPPRQTSVPVIVHVGERLVRGGGARAGGVLALFAAALALLALLVCALLAYIYRSKRRKSSSETVHNKNAGFVSHEKSRPPSAGAVAPVSSTGAGLGGTTGGTTLAAGGGSGSLLSVSAGASTILANSTSSLDLRADHNGNNSSSRPAVAAVRQQEQGGAAAPRGGRRRVADERPPARARLGPLGRGVARAHHPREGQEAQLGRARPAQRGKGQRGGGSPRRHQPRSGGAHEPHRLLLGHDTNSDAEQYLHYDPQHDSTNKGSHPPRDAQPTNHNNQISKPNRKFVLPDSTTDTRENINALYPSKLKETPNYEDQHHLPKATNRPLRTSTEILNSQFDNAGETQRIRSGPKISREENLPGSTFNGLPNHLYDHTEQQIPYHSHKNNDHRIIQNLSQYTTADQQTDVPFSSILDKHTAFYRQYALPDTTNLNHNVITESQNNRKPSNNPRFFNHNQRKESKTNSKKSVGSYSTESVSSQYPHKDDKPVTQYDSPIIQAPSEFSDVEHSPLPPMTMSFSNMRTMPISNINLTERQLPTEYVPIPVKKISQISKHNKPKKKNTPPRVPMKPNLHSPAPVKYIPINLDNPMVNPEFLPIIKGKNTPSKKVTPPRRPPSPIEYIPILINPKTGHPQALNRPQKGIRHPHSGPNRPRTKTPVEAPVFVTQPSNQRYVMHPSAPRLSYSSMDAWRNKGPSPFASIDPRKLRTQRVSPLIFVPTVPIYKPL